MRAVTGNSLPGAIGKTRRDQEKIDRTVARLCRTGAYTRTECAGHTQAVAASGQSA